jgi:hypothetical protein
MNRVHDDVSMEVSTMFNVPLSVINNVPSTINQLMQTAMENAILLRFINEQMSIEETNYEFEIASDSDEDFDYPENNENNAGNIFDIRHHIEVRPNDMFQPRNFIMRPDCLRTDTPIINDTCCICLDGLADTDKQIAQLDTCQHGFCRECLFIWLKTHCLCPVCRTVCTKINLIK